MKIKYFSLLLLMTIVLASCKKDDDSVTQIPLRDRAEQQIVDRDSLIGYLETHYYNSSVFETGSDHTISELIITELPQDSNGNYLPVPDPENNTLLSASDKLETFTKTFMDVSYDYYILKLNAGGGTKNPTFVDKVRLNYSGNLLDEVVFDNSVTPVDFELLSVIKGWGYVLPNFKGAAGFDLTEDGTVMFHDFGLGVMFLPSGLGYFGNSPSGIPSYSNLIFKFEMFQVEVNDHDNDGIPSFVENLNLNDDINDDDTDTDLIPNFIDVDDDGDGVLTLNELQPKTYTVNTNMGETEPVLAAGEYERSRTVNAGVITIKTVKVMDSNSDGLADYLDSTIEIDYLN